MNTKSLSQMNVAVKVLLSIIFMIACANISIPLNPIPITLHTVGVLLIGFALKPKEALFALLGYVALGASGFPVFTGFVGGIDVLMGIKAGFYFGFIAAVLAVSTLKEKFHPSSAFSIFIVCSVGQMLIYAFGVLWMSKFVGFEKSVALGLAPFILPGIVKCVLFTMMLKASRILRK